ncbi:MAG: VWA domain-containing protein [Gammaproteobacteria bacterium]|nr:VWA domain-containing protein [Gammaproteobacteria bacterium]
MELTAYRERLRCNVARVDEIFPAALAEAGQVFSPAGLESYLDAASAICGMGRGQALPVLFLEGMPEVARHCGEGIIDEVVAMVRLLSRTSNANAIHPFLATLPAIATRLRARDLMDVWFSVISRLAQTAAEGLIPMLAHVEHLLGDLTIGALDTWVSQGIKGYENQPWRFGDWFSLQTADSRAALQRLRHGTLFIDNEARIAHTLRALWGSEENCHPYSAAFDILRKPVPYLDSKGLHMPDVYHDQNGIRGIDRYRALLAHLAAHRTWTRPFIADNFNRYQQLAIETFEDARVEWLAMQRYPGLRRLWLALHPLPVEGDCPTGWSCLRHKLAMLLRALLDPDHPYTDATLRDFVARFHARMAEHPHDTRLVTELATAYVVAVHEVDFRSPKVWFEDTEVSYRDDNRFMWIFLEDTNDEDDFHSDHNVSNPRETESEQPPLFVRHQREWDVDEQRYKHDFVTVQEHIAPDGDPRRIDALLERHKPLAKQLKRIVDLLKPQQHTRVRYQEEGSELDLDVAVRAMVDHRAGVTPDPRIHMRHVTAGRDIAVMLLLDLSESVNQVPDGAANSILQLSQEAAALLGWAIDALGDAFAIGGFASDTRHEVHYLHFKGFNEPWGDGPKARLAAMQGGLSTRMGAGVRTAGHYLSKRSNARKLLLLLTDGEPHDVDVDDPAYLRADTKKAVEELAGKGVATYCISLDSNADAYVSEIFGAANYTIVDHIERLPERLPRLFMALTR